MSCAIKTRRVYCEVCIFCFCNRSDSSVCWVLRTVHLSLPKLLHFSLWLTTCLWYKDNGALPGELESRSFPFTCNKTVSVISDRATLQSHLFSRFSYLEAQRLCCILLGIDYQMSFSSSFNGSASVWVCNCFAAHEVARINFTIDVHQYNQEPMNRYRLRSEAKIMCVWLERGSKHITLICFESPTLWWPNV